MSYDWAAENNRTIGVRQKSPDIHQHTDIVYFERAREDQLISYHWLTDTAAGPWFYQKSETLKSVDQLADIVIKNGCLLLDVSSYRPGHTFATKGDALYAITLAVPKAKVKIKSLGANAGKVTAVTPAWKQGPTGVETGRERSGHPTVQLTNGQASMP